jgi:Cullin family
VNQVECGGQFTNKLEGMFKDVELSRDIMASFKQSVHAPAPVQGVTAHSPVCDLSIHARPTRVHPSVASPCAPFLCGRVDPSTSAGADWAPVGAASTCGGHVLVSRGFWFFYGCG